jgi:hypothetical protein
MVRLWDPIACGCVFEIPTRYSVHALTATGWALIVALSNGAMAISLA